MSLHLLRRRPSCARRRLRGVLSLGLVNDRRFRHPLSTAKPFHRCPSVRALNQKQWSNATQSDGGGRAQGQGGMCDLRRGGFSLPSSSLSSSLSLSSCGLALMGIQPKHRHPIERGAGTSSKMTVFRRVSSEEDTRGGRVRVFFCNILNWRSGDRHHVRDT